MKRFSCLVVAICTLGLASFGHAAIEVEGRTYEVVDMHLHSGKVGDLNSDAKGFIVGLLPPFAALYYPGFADLAIDPYAANLGIKDQLNWAGVDYGVLLATFTHHTVGFFTNNALESLLDDSRNRNGDGQKKFWGLASINLDEFDSPGVAEHRVSAMASYFEKRTDLFIGIKLAHAHQGVEFDDPNMLPIYDVAATFQKPVLLHTGRTPHKGAVNELDYYDPISLESTITNYSGENGGPRVEFILSHVGKGDARSVEHSLYLAEQYDNVWLELSAIGTALELDEAGNTVEYSEPVYVWILDEIKRRNLVGRSIYASDGPQSSGMVRAYTEEIVQAMLDANYTPDDLQKILADNFFDCFFGGRP